VLPLKAFSCLMTMYVALSTCACGGLSSALSALPTSDYFKFISTSLCRLLRIRRTAFRETAKSALSSFDFTLMRSALAKAVWMSIPIPGADRSTDLKPSKDFTALSLSADDLKHIAFQLGQTLALMKV
jgi:hypothetical protein